MAKEESSKVVLERTYTIPLSRELLKVPAYKKAKKESKVKPAKKIVEAEAKPLEEAVAGKAGGEKPKEAKEEEAEKDEKEDIAEQKKELSQTHHHAPKQPKEAHFEDIHPRAPKHQ